MPIGVVFAVGAEQGCFEDLLTDVTTQVAQVGTIRTGRLAGRTVTTIVAGAGPAAAAAGCEALLRVHHSRTILSAGFCGGLQPHLRRNHVVVADRIFDSNGTPHDLDPSLRTQLRLPPGCVGPWATVDRIVAKAADKHSLGERTGAWVCEMESLAAAKVCEARGVPFLAVRSVSDAVDDDLPGDLDSLLNAKTTAATIGAIVGTLWRRPASVKDLWRLKEHALTAADALAKQLADIVRQLPEDKLAPTPLTPEP